ncbi:MAG: glycine betaine ABC transporter substrate-binding protein [Thermoanaerobaculia bacterium]
MVRVVTGAYRAGAVCLAALAVLAFGLAGPGCRPADPSVRVGSKNFSEQVLLGEIAAQSLEARGVKVDRRFNLGGTFICHRGLTVGELDLYPEYTGTAFTAILSQKPVSDPAAVRAAVGRDYAKRWDLVWSPPLGFENTFALVVRGKDARRLGLSKISDLAAHPDLKPGFGYEFVEREDGWKGLARAYGLAFRQRPAEMDLGLLYPALNAGHVDVVAGNSTDGLIAAQGGVVLEDDRRYFPPYEAAFVVRGSLWRRDTRVRAALDALNGAIDAAAMRKLNAAVDRDKRRPQEVAREFLLLLGQAGSHK